MISDKNSQEIHEIAEESSAFPGGKIELVKYICGKIKYPQAAIDNNTTVVVTIHFVVEINGKVIEVKIKRDIGDGCGRRYNHLEFNYP